MENKQFRMQVSCNVQRKPSGVVSSKTPPGEGSGGGGSGGWGGGGGGAG